MNTTSKMNTTSEWTNPKIKTTIWRVPINEYNLKKENDDIKNKESLEN